MLVNKLPLVVAVTGALLLGTTASQAEGLTAKQLAGPPSEFAMMQMPDPSASAIQSKAALIPVTFAQNKAGQRAWSGQLPIENGQGRVLVFAPEGEQWDLFVSSPNGGIEKAAGSVARVARDTVFGMDKAEHAARYYAFDAMTPGSWNLKLTASGPSHGGYLLLEGDDRTELSSYQTHRKQWVGQTQQIASLLTFAEAEGMPKLGLEAGQITRATLRVTAPNGEISEYAMFDDGLHGDALAGDGIVGGEFPTKLAGQYLAQVQVQGRDVHGQDILRSAEHVIPVVQNSLRLAGTKSTGATAEPGRLSVRLPLAGAKAGGNHYRAYAEVWGRDGAGQDVAVAWIGGMVELENGAVSLGMDDRWVARSKATGDFELRNLRIEDPDHFVTLVDAKRMPLSLPAVSKRAVSDAAIDEDMLMGKRPDSLNVLEKGTGSRLLLVHGYCSGDVWPAGNFSSASKFLDLNQNRSHDQFAQRIKTFGNTWNSYGIVAHSQGGAAALHLYTYYWSGLDNATGSRLIQSVGTPYQGTNLAGILATLGNWFGVGCGTNDNLTYSGASSWLAGIPSWARSKVNYYTTSFKSTNWWTNDYCNFATDLVLSDPEDGTTEKAYGQLSGAVNRGHTTGQCHTTGMRDPAQYQDSSRNATMNSNAAR